jgi:hypothetical protein
MRRPGAKMRRKPTRSSQGKNPQGVDIFFDDIPISDYIAVAGRSPGIACTLENSYAEHLSRGRARRGTRSNAQRRTCAIPIEPESRANPRENPVLDCGRSRGMLQATPPMTTLLSKETGAGPGPARSPHAPREIPIEPESRRIPDKITGSRDDLRPAARPASSGGACGGGRGRQSSRADAWCSGCPR